MVVDAAAITVGANTVIEPAFVGFACGFFARVSGFAANRFENG